LRSECESDRDRERERERQREIERDTQIESFRTSFASTTSKRSNHHSTLKLAWYTGDLF